MVTITVTIATSVASAMLVFLLQSVIKENKKLKEEQEKEVEEKKKADEERIKAIENGLRCLLRKELIADHEKWMTRGYITSKALESGLLMYDSYKELGGNGMIDHMKDEIESLPIKERVL
jgi:hypothetical protein